MNAIPSEPPIRYLLEDWLDARKAKRRAEQEARRERALRGAVTRKRNRETRS